ncbi:hypothetical protein ACGVWS_01830 [Enterobacteriaceae bacterium LUAb1]
MRKTTVIVGRNNIAVWQIFFLTIVQIWLIFDGVDFILSFIIRNNKLMPAFPLTQEIVDVIKRYARSLFDPETGQGFKSPIKTYTMEYGNRDTEDKNRRNLHSRLARESEILHTIGSAECVRYPLEAGQRSGNAAEYAVTARNYALQLYPQCPAWLFQIKHPVMGQHVFCALGMEAHPPTLRKLHVMKSRNDYQSFICDPWMNISCPYSQYPQKFHEKAIKWLMDGKLITPGMPPRYGSEVPAPVWAEAIESTAIICVRIPNVNTAIQQR